MVVNGYNKSKYVEKYPPEVGVGNRWSRGYHAPTLEDKIFPHQLFK